MEVADKLITISVMEVACELAHARVFDEFRDILEDEEGNIDKILGKKFKSNIRSIYRSFTNNPEGYFNASDIYSCFLIRRWSRRNYRSLCR